MHTCSCIQHICQYRHASKLTAELLSCMNGSTKEYLKLSDVYKMYGSDFHDTKLTTASSHGFLLALDPSVAPREVSLLLSSLHFLSVCFCVVDASKDFMLFILCIRVMVIIFVPDESII